MLTVNEDSKTLPTQLLAWANADKEATTMHFAMSNDWLRWQQAMGGGEIIFFEEL